jgi:hypothetical protein
MTKKMPATSVMLKEEQMALAAAAPSAASGDAQAGAGVSHSLEPPAAPDHPTLVEPQSPPPAPPKRMTMAEINDAARARIPSHWLRGPPEPWRPYIHWFL